MKGIVSGGLKLALGIVISKAIVFMFRKLLPSLIGLTSFLWGMGYDVKAVPIWIADKFELSIAYIQFYAQYAYNYGVYYVQTFNEKLSNTLPLVPVEVFWGLVALMLALAVKVMLGASRAGSPEMDQSAPPIDTAAIPPSKPTKKNEEDDILAGFI